MAGMTCPFCAIFADLSVATTRIVRINRYEMILEPRNPVTPGHLLVVPRKHVTDFAQDPNVFAELAFVAANYTRLDGSDADGWNLITSLGAAATQTIGHLHIHLVPRHAGDGLKLPWSPA